MIGQTASSVGRLCGCRISRCPSHDGYLTGKAESPGGACGVCPGIAVLASEGEGPVGGVGAGVADGGDYGAGPGV